MLSRTRLIAKIVLAQSKNKNAQFYSSYRKFPSIEEFKPTINNFEVSRSPEEWKFVERLLPLKSIQEPVPQESYQTDWKPPTAKFGDYDFYIKRNRNHMLPVYLSITHRGTRHVTEIRRIEGDIHKMADELKNIAEKSSGRVVAVQTNELAGFIRLKGDHVRVIKDYLMNLGF